MRWAFSIFCVRMKVMIPCFIVIMFIRFYQMLSIENLNELCETFSDYYVQVSSINLATFIFAPLYCILTSSSVKFIDSEISAVKWTNRKSVAYNFASLALLQSIIYVAFINATALPVIFIFYNPVGNVIPFLTLSVITQIAFFMICNLIFSLIYTLTKRTYISYIVTVIYFTWDLVTAYVPASLPGIGWGLTQLIDTGTVLRKVALLVSILMLSVILNLIASSKVDYLSRHEGEQNSN